MAINRVTIMGNLTRDAELRKKGDATSVLTFGLAINEKKKDSETGEYVDAPVFVDCALFGARAEALAPYLTKGKKVSVDGRLRYHSWMKNDEKRHALSVLVTDIEFADSKGAGKDTVSAQGQSTEPETYDADIPFWGGQNAPSWRFSAGNPLHALPRPAIRGDRRMVGVSHTYGFGRFRKRGCCGIRRVLGTFRHRRLRACTRIRFP